MHHKLTLAFACACALMVALFGVALFGAATLRAETTPEPDPSDPSTTTTETDAETNAAPELSQSQRQRMIDRYRHEAWRWQRVMRRSVTRKLPNAPEMFTGKVEAWKKTAERMRWRANNPPHKSQWLCIHRYEGAWTSNTGNGYYGGLQMDVSFQRAYAPGLLRRKGTADRWTALEQMWAAERSHRSGRGFYPWPNTARYCGLI
ncbi:hypothetical protein BH18ACT12_BH18ACT12_05510 [soil metagenome]